MLHGCKVFMGYETNIHDINHDFYVIFLDIMYLVVIVEHELVMRTVNTRVVAGYCEYFMPRWIH